MIPRVLGQLIALALVAFLAAMCASLCDPPAALAGPCRPEPRPAPGVRIVPSPTAQRRAKADDGCGCSGKCECDPEDCPCRKTARLCQPDCACVLPAAGEAGRRNGVEWDKVGELGPRYTWRGREVTRDQAARLIQGRLVDDSLWLRVTVIGKDAEGRNRIAREATAHPGIAGKALVQAYAPDDPMIAGLGFVHDEAQPTVYVQAPDGKVLHRQTGYRGVEQLAEAVRKAAPSYDPGKDPDVMRPAVPKLADLKLPEKLSDVPTPAWCCCGAALLCWLIARKKEE